MSWKILCFVGADLDGKCFDGLLVGKKDILWLVSWKENILMVADLDVF